MERIPEIYFAVFGTLKAGCVIGPLFSAFGPDPVRDRMEDSGAKVLITQPDLRKKIAEILPQLPDLEHIIVVNKNGRSTEPLAEGDLDYYALMNEASDDFGPIATTRDDYSIMHYTSGTTGKPKGAVHRHNAVIQHYLTGKWCLDLHPDDIYWCTADPGWVTGTSYGMSAPWTNGVTQVIYEGGFSARKWYQILEDYKVTVWYSAPTAIRMLMKSGVELPKTFDLSNLRFAASVGEPLNPEAVEWGVEAIGMPFHDNWWQTETGGIMIANYACMDIRPGSMGRPLPGIEPGIIDAEGNEKPDGQEGNLAVRTPWPSMFQTYWQQEERYDSRFVNGWYITGDEAVRDSDGYYWFIGRSDDVINTAGHPRRPVRGRVRPHRAPRGRRGRRHRQAGPHRDGGRQGVRLAQGRLRAERRTAPRADGLRTPEARRRRRTARDRDHPRPAQDPQRQNHAPPPQGPRTRPRRG